MKWYFIFMVVLVIGMVITEYFCNQQKLACIQARGEWSYEGCKFPENQR